MESVPSKRSRDSHSERFVFVRFFAVQIVKKNELRRLEYSASEKPSKSCIPSSANMLFDGTLEQQQNGHSWQRLRPLCSPLKKFCLELKKIKVYLQFHVIFSDDSAFFPLPPFITISLKHSESSSFFTSEVSPEER